MKMSFSDGLLLFIIYSIIGWVCETALTSILNKRFINRGFLSGPYCPIYGFGAILMLMVTAPIRQYPLLVFLVTTVFAAVITYLTSLLLEFLFQKRWWNYTGKRFQLQGRVSLATSLVIGIVGCLLIYWVNPFVKRLLFEISGTLIRVIGNIVVVLLILDFLSTLKKYANQQAPATVESGTKPALTPQNKLDTVMSEELSSTIWEKLSSVAKNLWHSVVSEAKKIGRSIATQFNYHHLFWVFTLASVIGYVVETAFCLVTRGVIESRQGMLYGPFNQIYGFGAVLMVLLLSQLEKKKDRWLFFGGAILGGAFEILCSYIQEYAFGSVSWNYSERPFAIAGGRTSLLFMLFWGILGTWFIKGVHPWMKRVIKHIPNRQGITFTSVLTVLLLVNMFLSGTAVARWVERTGGEPPTNGYEEFLDQTYPDERMIEVYPNLMMTEK